MQSLLQYRRFGRHVREQYERDRDKAKALGQETHHSETTSPDSSSRDNSTREGIIIIEKDERDAEKGEQAGEKRDDNNEDGGVALSTEPMQQATTVPTQSSMTNASQVVTQRSIGMDLGIALTGINVRDRTTKEGPSDPSVHGNKVFVVGYEGERDSLNPHNWSYSTRICATVNIAFIGWIVGFASSVDSAVLRQASEDFGVSEAVESLATGLFLVGFGTGALFAGPVSETVGRNPVYIVTLSLFMIFVLASALAPNIGAQLVFRFIAGLFGSTPLTCAGGSISDLWSPMERVYAFPVFANAAFMGPIFGPVVGGFIGESSLVSWRWTEWVTLIISGLILASIIFLQPETYAPILLKWKAAHLRSLTADERYKAEVEIREETFWLRLRVALYRPFILTFQEPVIMLLALYLTVIYIILFTFLNGYTFIFTETYGFSEGITGLSFIGIGLGLCLASLLVPFIYRFAKQDLAKIKAKGGTRLPPESRLWFAMLGAPAIPISLFWMGWTARPSVSCWSPLLASVLFGYGILCVFISSYQYIIDSYETYAASALASVTLIRYVAAGGSIEYAIPFYTKVGVPWTLTILGAISALCVPLPYLFFVFGPRIRTRSKYAVV
ncbi:MAG: hypothetical protein Q9186_003306 [Xanthomendoza sp. 1 TL-2023]